MPEQVIFLDTIILSHGESVILNFFVMLPLNWSKNLEKPY